MFLLRTYYIEIRTTEHLNPILHLPLFCPIFSPNIQHLLGL
jgi:hypothetical protein